jgi:hypothetical protein
VSHGAEQAQSSYVTARERVDEASRRVAHLKSRLSAKREQAVQLAGQLNALQEAAVEAAVRGEEPASFTALEAALRDAQAGEHILEQALCRAKASLRTFEAESQQALLAEQEGKFANTLREFMQLAAKAAECHERLSQIHQASDSRYSPSLLWSAFAPGNDYAQWLRNAEDFLNRPRPEKDAAPSANRDHRLAASLTGNGRSERAETVEDVSTPAEPARGSLGYSHA